MKDAIDSKTRRSLLPFQYGAPGRIRTADHLVRSQVLYPAELRARGGRILAAFHAGAAHPGR